MLKRTYLSQDLETYEDWAVIKKGIKELGPEIAAFDTETTGLHIILDKPFIFQFGFLHPTDITKGYTFLVDFRDNPSAKQIINEWHDIVKTSKLYLGHNIKFDLHMLKNIGIEYRTENMSDTQFYIRYATDALHPEEGGAPLGLKDFVARYIDINAKYHEKLLAKQRTEIAKEYNTKLKNALAVLGAPPPKYKARSYTLGVVQELFKDPLFDIDDLPEDVKTIYLNWKSSLPGYLQGSVSSLVESDMIRYYELDKKNLHEYAHLDIVYTLEIYQHLQPVIEARDNFKGVALENSLILPFFDMERTGFLADKPYLEASKHRLKEYTKRLREEFKAMAGADITIGQHAQVKRILNEKFGLAVSSTGNAELEQVKNNLIRENPQHSAIQFINTLSELRTLEKWYSTYILRFEKDLQDSDRLYTTIHSVGAVSGRVTSDFQQFPKEPIVDRDGNELFHPRKMVLVPSNCKCLLYLDYSQIELRFQAMYTILVGSPDLNMCRAYMPYKCHDKNGTQFDYNNPDHLKRWHEEWHLNESDEIWEPTDVHAATTEAAGFSRSDPEFKHYRKTIGKRVNFAKNYGASLNKIKEMFPERSLEECKRIDNAYYTAFPGVKAYHQYCYDRAQRYPYTSNLFGIKYYNISGHKLRNTLVQGSAAHFLKYRIRALWEFLQNNHMSSRMQMQIHDELVFEIRKEDPDTIFKNLKEIMEDWPDALVPIVAEAEITKTNWAEKKDYEIEDSTST